MRTYNAMVRFCLEEHLHPSAMVRHGGMCQWFSRQAVGAASFGGSAIAAWNSIPHQHRHQGPPPAGSLAYWGGGSHGYGHAAVAVEGHRVFSTDILRQGHVDKVDYTTINRDWGLPYLGYITWTPSGPLPVLTPIKAKPVVHVSRVQPGMKGAEVLLVQRALHDEPGIRLIYTSGPGVFGPLTKDAYKQLQLQMGFRNKDADGKPGITSLAYLGGRHGFRAAL